MVLDSRADSSGYTADVEILDSVGDRTGHVLNGVAVDPLWLIAGGPGVFAPPEKDQMVAISWLGDEAGQPVIAAAAPNEPATPRLDVGAGEHSLQGAEWDVRMLRDEWYVRDDAGAEISGKGSRWRVAGPSDNAHDMLQAFLDVLINSRWTRACNRSTQPRIAALTGIKSRVSAIYRS